MKNLPLCHKNNVLCETFTKRSCCYKLFCLNYDVFAIQAEILNYHCGWNIVVMASHLCSCGLGFARFGTSGLGKEFIGCVRAVTKLELEKLSWMCFHHLFGVHI